MSSSAADGAYSVWLKGEARAAQRNSCIRVFYDMLLSA